MRVPLGSLLWLAAALGASPASGELGDDAARLAHSWRRHGPVVRLHARLAERGVPTVIFVPAEALGAARCATVAVLAPSSTHFVVRPVGGSTTDETVDDWPQPSLAGLVQLTRCGRRKAGLSALFVDMRSPRAVLEAVVVRGDEAARPAVEALPQRDPGPIVPFPEGAQRPPPPPLSQRLAAAEARTRREGAKESFREILKSSTRGVGRLRRKLEPGCHRVDLLAEGPTSADSSYDLMAVPKLDAAASLVAVERGDGLDASVRLCAGEESELVLEFGGAPAAVKVTVVGGSWPLPDGLPEAWGGTGKARIAALLQRHQVRIRGGPVDQALGIQGPTIMPVGVEPGACYVAVLAAVRGEPRGLALAALSGSVAAQNHGGPEGDGTLVSFCARSEPRAVIEADSRGSGLVWLYALFQTGRVAALGEPPR